MELTIDEIEQIERYQKNVLSEAEKKELEERMSSDPAYKSEVEAYVDSIRAVQFEAATQFKAKLDRMEPVRRKTLFPIKYVAACVLLAGVLGYFLVTWKSPANDLFTAYYLPYPNVEQPLSRSENHVYEAYRLYDLEEYEQAVELFIQEQDMASTFYAGQCYLALKNEQQAISYLTKIEKTDNKYSQAAQWYLALIALKQGDEKQAITYLEALSKTSDYSKKANELLDQL